MQNAEYGELFNYKGYNLAKEIMKLDVLEAIDDFEMRDSDIFIDTYPKSGTIWIQNIVCLILYEGHRNRTENISTSRRGAIIEYNLHNVDITQMPSPRIIMSHLPYYLVPKKLKAKKVKVIYMYRNPKDVLVSMFHYQNSFHEMENACFEEHMQRFLSGNVVSSLVFDHVKGWYAHQNELNILFLCYEEMIQDLRGAVLKTCRFIGKELSSQEVDKVVEMATFKNMKEDPRANFMKTYEECFGITSLKHIRKGTVGDWKNTMTVSQSEKFDNIFQAQMKDIDLKFIWDIKEIQSTQHEKIIYVFRNPKDVLVSRYHIYKILTMMKTSKEFDVHLEKFLAGKVHGSLWLDHIEGWTTHKDNFNILFLSYEEMKKDLRSSVLKICNFLGRELTEKEVDDVVHKATFDNMQADSRTNYVVMNPTLADSSKGVFLRKGTIGDWKNLMTVVQSERFDRVFKERMEKLPFKFCWDIQEDL